MTKHHQYDDETIGNKYVNKFELKNSLLLSTKIILQVTTKSSQLGDTLGFNNPIIITSV